MTAPTLVLALLAFTAGSAGALRCNTYIGTDFYRGGPGTESCPPYPARECVMLQYRVLGVRTYSMACDDLFQCARQPLNSSCCTSSFRNSTVVVRCSATDWNVTWINHTSFGPECSTRCRDEVWDAADRSGLNGGARVGQGVLD